MESSQLCAAETKPVDTFNELLSWTKSDKTPTACNLTPRSRALSGREWLRSGRTFENLRLCDESSRIPKTLFCHDLKGGYLEDRFVGGAECLERPYTFQHWSCIDTFVYFSHHFVTVPPVGWIEAAHKHGVAVLGTIITEWEAGKKLCSEILADVDTFVSKCVEILVAENFDGWLVNIENSLEEADVKVMITLVHKLTEAVHRVRPAGQVIWYDSVTIDGKLAWQNELNSKNKDFFYACDGIFLNYTWKTDQEVDNLQASIQCLSQDNRLHDIYVGIDIFGRGCFGGGGFNTKAALELARAKNMSVALFAPSWTYEAAAQEVPFLQREYNFWNLLESCMFFRGPKFTAAACKSTLTTEPCCLFSTRFNVGCEMRNVEKGNNWWLDMARQDHQVTFLSLPLNNPETSVATSHAFTDQEEKGVCLQLTSSEDSKGEITVPLLLCELPNEKGVVITLAYDWKSHSGPHISIVLMAVTRAGDRKPLSLTPLQAIIECLKSTEEDRQDCQEFAMFRVPDTVESIEAVGVKLLRQSTSVILKELSVFLIPQ